MVQNSPRVAVIGAGGSGLCAVKTCLEGGLDVVCFDRSSTIGGLWVYRDTDQEGYPSVMKSTVINSSKEMSAFSDFPPPDSFPSFMHNRFMAEYLRMYAERFGVDKHVRLRHEVLKVTKAEDYDSTGRWQLVIKDLESSKEWTEIFEGVMLCAGHHVFPIVPEMPGLDSFLGVKMHTHSLKTAKGMEDKQILVVGNGNSGVDSAVELSTVAKTVYLSTRRGFWLFSRAYPGGVPLDSVVNRRYLNTIMPFSLAATALQFIASLSVDHKTFNIKPKHSAIAQHPTINDYLPAKILSGTIQIKGAIDRFTKTGVVFVGEEREKPIDVVVLATGYSYKVPCLDQESAEVDDTRCHLYKLVFPPHLPHPTLGFFGIIQPVGAIFPISEIQARWFVQLMKGNCKLPSQPEMWLEVERRKKFVSEFFVKASRHLTEVIWIEYMDSVAEEIGCKPNWLKLFLKDPVLGLQCVFGPCLPYQFRLHGPYPWGGARKAIMEWSNRTQAPLDTRKVVEYVPGKKVVTVGFSSVWTVLLIPVFMYILLFIM